MAQPGSPIAFVDIPIAEARMMTRGPRMDPLLHQTLQEKSLSLGDHATCMELAPEINRTTMKNRIVSVAREANIFPCRGEGV